MKRKRQKAQKIKTNMDCKKCKGQQMCCSQEVILTVAELKKVDPSIEFKNDISDNERIILNPGNTVCGFLNDNNKCNVYKTRPTVCREFDCCNLEQVQILNNESGNISAKELKKCFNSYLTPETWLQDERRIRLRNDLPVYPCGFPFLSKEDDK